MKSIFAVLFGVFFSMQVLAAEPTLIIVAILYPSHKAPLIQTGFQDSAFDYNERNDLTPRNKSMCYVGRASDVCGQIRGAERAINSEYLSGAHDNLKVLSCRFSGNAVEVVYQLTSDYNDDLRVERTIKPCMN